MSVSRTEETCRKGRNQIFKRTTCTVPYYLLIIHFNRETTREVYIKSTAENINIPVKLDINMKKFQETVSD